MAFSIKNIQDIPSCGRGMVTLIVATTIGPASIGPASALLAMPGWHPGPPIQDMPSFVNQDVRLLKHDSSIVREDHLDTRWEETTGKTFDEVIFLSKHTAASNRPALTVHSIGDQLPVGGKPAWAAPPNPRIGPWFRLLKSIADSHNLTPEFELVWEVLGLGGRDAVGVWSRKGGVWVGHLLAGYSLPMEDRGPSKVQANLKVGGTWRQAIRVAFDTTTAAFPQGEVLAHLDSKSFKGWQRNAIMDF